MSDMTGKVKAVAAAETGTAPGGNLAVTDLEIGGLDIQFLPPLQDGAGGTDNARVMAYRDRILEEAGRCKEKA